MEDLRTLDDSMDIFKNKLDHFLALILYSPRIDGGGCNLLDTQSKNWRWKLRYTVTKHKLTTLAVL